jgi:hypothetical protein
MALICRLPFDVSAAGGLVFQRSHFAQPAKVPLGLAKLGCQKRIDEISGHFRPYNPATHADDIHMVVFDSLSRREMIVNQARADADNLVCAHGGADTAAANGHAAFDLPGGDRPGEVNDKIGIVVARIQAVSPNVDQFMRRFAKMGNQIFL